MEYTDTIKTMCMMSPCVCLGVRSPCVSVFFIMSPCVCACISSLHISTCVFCLGVCKIISCLYMPVYYVSRCVFLVSYLCVCKPTF